MDGYKAIQIDLKKPQIRWLETGKYYSIFFVLYGICNFHYEEQHFVCYTEDIILLKPGNKIKLEFLGNKYPLQILWLQFQPDLLENLSGKGTDLKNLFQNIAYKCQIIHARSDAIMMIKNLSKKLLELPKQRKELGMELFEQGLLTMLFVLILRSCICEDMQKEKNCRKRLMIDDVFVYIREHLTEEISLEMLEKEFFVSKYHIAREFKKQTGQTVHNYIIKTKLDLCRSYIVQGKPITEVYQLGGFGGYNHFFRAFKKQYKMTPKEYYNKVLNGKNK